MYRSSRSIKIYIGILAAAFFLYEVLCLDKIIGYLDGQLYYSYLPKWFIEKDFGYYVKFPFGTAIMELPFFVIAHLLMLLINPVNAVGYGGLYEYAIGIAGIFYFSLGIYFIYLSISIIGKKTPAGEGKNDAFPGAKGIRPEILTVILMTFGTFLPYYATRYASMSHIYSFFMASAFVLLTVKLEECRGTAGESREAGEECEEGEGAVRDKTKNRYNFLLGFTAGMLFIIRNINIAFVMFYLLTDIKNFKEKIRPKRLLYNIAGGLIPVLPLLIYWKKTTGRFILNTYSDESFTFALRPKLYEVLLSDSKGILILSPILFFSLLGFICMAKKGRPERRYFLGTLFCVAFEIYITAAWWCWWLGGVYGLRAVIDVLPFLAIPMCSFIKDTFYKKYKAIYVIAAIFFIYANIAFMAAAERGMLNTTLSSWIELRRALLHF